jgi:hypothetical protein
MNKIIMIIVVGAFATSGCSGTNTYSGSHASSYSPILSSVGWPQPNGHWSAKSGWEESDNRRARNSRRYSKKLRCLQSGGYYAGHYCVGRHHKAKDHKAKDHKGGHHKAKDHKVYHKGWHHEAHHKGWHHKAKNNKGWHYKAKNYKGWHHEAKDHKRSVKIK